MSGKRIPLEEVPEVLGALITTVEELKAKVNDQAAPADDDDDIMSVEELMLFLQPHPAKQTIYGWCSARKIPHIKRGKCNFFRKGTIREWDAAGRPPCEDAPESLAEAYVNRKRLEAY